MNNAEIDNIAERYIGWFVGSYEKSIAEKELETMMPDGYWEDIDYKGENKPYWQIVEHLRRINHIAVNKMDSGAVIKGLEYWYSEKRIDTNWWWNDIGFPMELAECGVLLRKELPPKLKKCLINTFNTDIEDKWTGTNRAWFAQNVIVRGILEESSDLLERGKRYLEENIYIAELGEEGIQHDYAFAQHGRQLYNNAYGLQILADCARWVNIFSGTKLAFDEEKIRILCDYLLDGCGRMCFLDVPDFNTIGRDIVRGFRGRDTRMRKLLPVIELLKGVSDRKDELSRLERFIKGDKKAWEHMKMFSSLNIFTSLKNGFYSSVRFGSRYVMGGDLSNGRIINGEDKLSGYRGCFVSQYMITGREYDRIFPLWNWSYLPGVTCPDKEVRTEQGAVMSTSLAGGISSGICGLCAMELEEDFSEDKKESFGGKKAAFFFGDEVVHLGCALHSDTDIHTTLNQCLFAGDFMADGVSCGIGNIEGEFKHIIHGGIEYISLMPQRITVVAETRKEYWNRITEMSEKVLEENDVFTAYINHTDSDSYAYAVIPAAAKEYLPPEYVNGNKVQAVKRGKQVCAVFYEAAEVRIGGIGIISDGPCFVVTDGYNTLSSAAEGYKEANIQVSNTTKTED